MVKKREKHKNNWLIIVVAIVAVIALILAAVAMTKVNITGDAISDWIPWLKKDKVQEQTQVAGGGTGLSTNCIGDVYSVSDCHGICKTGQTCTKLGSSRNWCCVKDSSTENTQIGEGEVYRGLLSLGYDFSDEKYAQYLKGYEIVFDRDGKIVYEIIEETICPGDEYEFGEETESSITFVSSNGNTVIYQPWTGNIAGKKRCYCEDDPLPQGNTDCRREHGYPFGCVATSNSVCNECKRGIPPSSTV
jgi:hypothetical protein